MQSTAWNGSRTVGMRPEGLRRHSSKGLRASFGLMLLITHLYLSAESSAAARTAVDSWRDPRHFSWVARPARPGAPAMMDGTIQWCLWLACLVGSTGLGLTAVLALRRWHASEMARQDRALGMMAEDPALVELMEALAQTLPCESSRSQTESTNPGTPGPDGPANTYQEVLPQAAKDLGLWWAKFQKSNRVPGDTECEAILPELLLAAARMKEASDAPHLRPILLLISALQGLLKQLSIKSAPVTASELRTAASAVDLIQLLCDRPFRPDLVTEPPIRLLVVDDEPISRGMLSSALRKSFNEPDLAPDGKTALWLAEQKRYDLVLLDVEMPGLDGFEVCLKIHDTAQNFTTPVVFVTSHCDFDSRAKSATVGAHDLIGKPFGAFEMLLKALTLILRTRLQACGDKTPAGKADQPAGATAALTPDLESSANAASRGPLAHVKNLSTREQSELVRQANLSSPANTKSVEDRSVSPLPAEMPMVPRSVGRGGTPDRPVDGAMAGPKSAPGHLQTLRDYLISARGAALPAERERFLGEAFVHCNAICAEARQARRDASLRLGSALQVMLKKLIDRPAYCTASVFDTALTALDTLQEVRQRAEELDLEAAEIRLLVVDDDPVARRAFSGALQLAIARPDTAECGEAALLLARTKPYDLVFLDVIMPGIDGFKTCAKLHGLDAHGRTPVVFITSQDDLDSRAQATDSGGRGFIPKPALPCEIQLIALSFIVRGRLEARREAPWEQRSRVSSSVEALTS